MFVLQLTLNCMEEALGRPRQIRLLQGRLYFELLCVSFQHLNELFSLSYTWCGSPSHHAFPPFSPTDFIV
jgi:hypothetical protein